MAVTDVGQLPGIYSQVYHVLGSKVGTGTYIIYVEVMHEQELQIRILRKYVTVFRYTKPMVWFEGMED